MKTIKILYSSWCKTFKNPVKVDFWYVWSVRFWSKILIVLNAYYSKGLKKLMDLVPFQKELECHQHILDKVWVC